MQAVLTIIVVIGAVALAAFVPGATMTAIGTTVIATLVVDALRTAGLRRGPDRNKASNT